MVTVKATVFWRKMLNGQKQEHKRCCSSCCLHHHCNHIEWSRLNCKNVALAMKMVKREDFKRNSLSIITLIAYVGQWIEHVICACISIRCNCTKHFLHTKISTVHVRGTGLLIIMYKGNEKDFQFKWKDTFLPHSQYTHSSIPACYWTLFSSTQLYKQKLIQISYLLLSSTDFIKFLTDIFSKIINHKMHQFLYMLVNNYIFVDIHPEYDRMSEKTCSCFNSIFFKKQPHLCWTVIPLHSTGTLTRVCSRHPSKSNLTTTDWHFMDTNACV